MKKKRFIEIKAPFSNDSYLIDVSKIDGIYFQTVHDSPTIVLYLNGLQLFIPNMTKEQFERQIHGKGFEDRMDELLK